MSRVSRARAAAKPPAAAAEPAPDAAEEFTPSSVVVEVVSALSACQRDPLGYTQAVPVLCRLYAEAPEELLTAL